MAVDIYKIPLSEFLGGHVKGEGQKEPDDIYIDEMGKTFPPVNLTPIPGKPDYATGPANGDLEDQILFKKITNGWEAVGCFLGPTVVVKRGHPGLGVELILSCTTHRKALGEKLFTEDGFKAAKRAHRIAIERALAQGEEVPAEVLVDYPDLLKKIRNGK